MAAAGAEHAESLLCLWELTCGLAQSLWQRSWSEHSQTRSSLAFPMLRWPIVGGSSLLDASSPILMRNR